MMPAISRTNNTGIAVAQSASARRAAGPQGDFPDACADVLPTPNRTFHRGRYRLSCIWGREEMDIHKVKPVHSWREFASEVGVIVIGVLIALSGEQAVEALHWSERVKGAEASMRFELATDDGPQARLKIVQSRCVESQLRQVERALLRTRDRKAPLPVVTVTAPYVWTWDQTSWTSAQSSGATAHMSDKKMYDWSGPFELTSQMNDITEKEADDYAELKAVETASPHPSAAMIDHLLTLVYRARGENKELTHLSATMISLMKGAGVQMTPGEERSMLARPELPFYNCSVAQPASTT